MTVSAPAQPRREDDRAQRPRDEGVDHVEGRHVDHDPAGAMPPDQLGQLVAQLHHLAVGQVRLDRGDEVVALAEDRHRHRRDHLGLEVGGRVACVGFLR